MSLTETAGKLLKFGTSMNPYTYGLSMAAPSLFKGVNSLFNKAPQETTSNDTTAYLNKLRNVSKEGLYGQDVKNEIGADIQQSSQNTRNVLRGNAVQSGMENSGVLAQQLLQEGGQTTLAAARMAKKIAEMNETSKLEASAQAANVGQSVADRDYRNALSRSSRREDIAGSFGSGLMDYVGGVKDFGDFTVEENNKKIDGGWPPGDLEAMRRILGL